MLDNPCSWRRDWWLMSSSPAPPKLRLSVAGLTSEQLQRIEQNKRRAQNRLLAKRKVGPHQDSSFHQALDTSSVYKATLPPQAKRTTALNNPGGTPVHDSTPQETQTTTSKTFPFIGNSSSSSSSHSSNFISKPNYVPVPQQPIALSTAQPQPATIRTNPPYHAHFNQPFPVSSQGKSIGTICGQAYLSSKGRTHQMSSIAAKPELEVKYFPLQKRIKANFIMLSKTRFKVDVTFDAKVIEIFRKMSTRSYGN